MSALQWIATVAWAALIVGGAVAFIACLVLCDERPREASKMHVKTH